MSHFLISQILIGIAFLFDFAAFQFKKRETTHALLTASSAIIAAHYFLLGAIAGGCVVVVSSLRFFVSIFTTKFYVRTLFIIITLGIGMVTVRQVIDCLPVIAAIIATFAAFQKNEKRLRVCMMVTTSLFITYNIFVWSPAAIALESFFLISNIISYIRFYQRFKEKEIF